MEEEIALRQALRNHWELTGSARAQALLESGERLPFTRLQPVSLPCAVEETWSLASGHRDTTTPSHAKPACAGDPRDIGTSGHRNTETNTEPISRESTLIHGAPGQVNADQEIVPLQNAS